MGKSFFRPFIHHAAIRMVGGLFLVGLLAAPIPAQVVQLPTFEYFTVQTSVLVPDRGAAYLGGVTRSRYASSSRGVPLVGKLPGAGPLFRNRGFARSQSTAGASVTATIIDHAEWDRAVLAAAEQRIAARSTASATADTASSDTASSDTASSDTASGDTASSDTAPEAAISYQAVSRRADYLARHVATHDPGPGVEEHAGTDREEVTVEMLRRRNEAAQRQRQQDARLYWQRGQQAERAGKLGAAQVYYKLAARNAASPARERILDYLRERF